MLTSAFSDKKSRMRVMEADSRVSPVSALKANPRTAIRYETTEMSVIWCTRRFGETGTNLVSDGVEQGINNLLRKPPLLVLVHLHHLPPVGSNLGQVQTFTQVHQVQDILLETRASETDGRLQEFRANARIVTDGVGNFVDVRASGFADCGESVDGGYTLGKHGIGSELGQF